MRNARTGAQKQKSAGCVLNSAQSQVRAVASKNPFSVLWSRPKLPSHQAGLNTEGLGWRGGAESQKSAGFLPVVKDLTALSTAWVRKAEPLDPLWYQGFPVENPYSQVQNQTS